MKSIDKIPTSKIQRASKVVKMGAKVGVNYLKYNLGKLFKTEEEARKELEESNAQDIYKELKELKGSTLKIAQMLSMEENILPTAYIDKFALAQYSVPPLSAPLVRKVFKKYIGKFPEEVFDYFNTNSTNAASIGQVHKAELGKKSLAVKIQYPGVADSITSDINLVRPLAERLFNMKRNEADKYFEEVEQKLIEETDYQNELKNSVEISNACKEISYLLFPKYYEEYSGDRVLTMDWMNGEHLSEFVKKIHSKEVLNKIGQTIWDFYMFQFHKLRKVHADPHPGNFLINENNELIVLDFGCTKKLDDKFYEAFFKLTDKSITDNKSALIKVLYDLEIFNKTDTTIEQNLILDSFGELLKLTTEPFHQKYYDFSKPAFFEKFNEIGETISKRKELRKLGGNRGSKHFIYINRTFFGLYKLLFLLKADRIETNHFKKYL